MAANDGSFRGTAVGELAANDQLAINIGRAVIALLKVLPSGGVIPLSRWAAGIARLEVLV